MRSQARSRGTRDESVFELLLETADYEPINALPPKLWITLTGARAKTEEVDIGNPKKSKTPFRKGQVDEYALKTASVGPLKSMKIRLDEKSHPHIKLTLATACLTHVRTGKRYIFSINKCLSFDEDAGAPEFDVPPAIVSEGEVKRPAPGPMRRGKPSRGPARPTAPARPAAPKPSSGSESEAISPPGSLENSQELSSGFRFDKVPEQPLPEEKPTETPEEKPVGNSDTKEASPAEQKMPKNLGLTSLVRMMKPGLQEIIEDDDESPKPRSVFRRADQAVSDTGGSTSKWAVFKKYTFHEMKVLLGRTLHEAIQAKDLERVQELVEFNPRDIKLVDERGYSPLHSACEVGSPEITYFLCKEGADLHAETPTGYQPIQIASSAGQLDCVKVLIDNGVDKETLTVDGSTLVQLAARHGHLDIVKWLVKLGAEPNTKDKRGRSALVWALKFGHKHVVEYLKDFAPEDTGVNDEEPPPDQVIPKSLSKKFSQQMALIEKRRNFRTHREKMSKRSSSFLDAIRFECDDD